MKVILYYLNTVFLQTYHTYKMRYKNENQVKFCAISRRYFGKFVMFVLKKD